MARKVIEHRIEDEKSRDNGKLFVITEMSADAGERFAIKALLALTNAGADLPDGAAESGMAGLAAAGIKALAKLPYEAAQPLLDEMLSCIKFKPASNIPPQPIYADDACQIEEIKTFFQLRMKVFEVHTGFSAPV